MTNLFESDTNRSGVDKTPQSEIKNFGKAREYLKEGVRPIMADLLDKNNIGNFETEIEKIKKEGEYINFHGEPEVLAENKITHAGRRTYVISDVNERDKYSDGYWNCTGIAVIGIDKKTQKEVSFLSHQAPTVISKINKNSFENDLSKSIELMLQRCEDGTVDVVMFGGRYVVSNPEFFKKTMAEYIVATKTVKNICFKKLGFEPLVIAGPDMRGYPSTSVYLDTQERRLYLLRPPQKDNLTNSSFKPSDVKEESRKWPR